MNEPILAAILLCLFTVSAQAQWEIATPPPTTADLRGVDNVGRGIVWVSGTSGTVLRSEDDGYLWQRCSIPPGAEQLDFRGIQAFDANTAIVMSSGKGPLSRLYKTTDGCQSWTLLFTNPDPEGFWDALQFNSRDFGVVLGDPVNNIFVLMLTFNGGQKWERQTLRATEDINGESVFAASNSSLVLGRSGHYFGTGGKGGPRIISVGAGPTDVYEGDVSKTKKLPWSTSINAERLPSTSASETAGVFSLAENSGPFGYTVAVGGDYSRPDDRTDTAWTNVFQNSSNPRNMFGFKAATTPPHGYRSAVAYDAHAKTWITVGPNGTDISTDDGRNWRALHPNPAFQEPPDADQHWNALSLPFVVGPHGRIGKLRPSALKPPSLKAAKP